MESDVCELFVIGLTGLGLLIGVGAVVYYFVTRMKD
jgi:hypothetical protein